MNSVKFDADVEAWDDSTDAADVELPGNQPVLSVTPSSLFMNIDDTEQLTAKVYPADADQTVTYTSSDESVAKVDATGLVTAVAGGTATITVTTADGTRSVPVPVTVAYPDGAVHGGFSVSPTQRVYFSNGNLRATTTNGGSTWTWSFAPDQYDCLGLANPIINGNGTIKTLSSGVLDLFGWSTAATKLGINNSGDDATYAGDFVDWGNDPEVQAGIGTGWRTLTYYEWDYVLNNPDRSDTRYCKAKVNKVAGVVLFPDKYTHPTAAGSAPTSVNNGSVAYTTNTWTAAQWTAMESAGAVFLPITGYRDEENDVVWFSLGDGVGFYWSSTPWDATQAIYLYVGDTQLGMTLFHRNYGMSVRLVMNVNN